MHENDLPFLPASDYDDAVTRTLAEARAGGVNVVEALIAAGLLTEVETSFSPLAHISDADLAAEVARRLVS